MNELRRECLLAAALVTICVIGRAIDHDPNATPVAAAALFAGFAIRRRVIAVIVPLASMALADLFFKGGYDPVVMISVYAAITLPVFLRSWLSGRWPVLRVVGASLCGSAAFFLLTNFAVWVTGRWGYEWSLAGLLHCYSSALPFLRHTVIGDLSWAGGFFGTWVVAEAIVRGKAASDAAVTVTESA